MDCSLLLYPIPHIVITIVRNLHNLVNYGPERLEHLPLGHITGLIGHGHVHTGGDTSGVNGRCIDTTYHVCLWWCMGHHT